MLNRLLLLLLFSAILGAAANTWGPRSIPWHQSWTGVAEKRAEEEGFAVASVQATKGIIEAGSHLVFDARSMEDYDAGHIPSAMPMPFQEVDESFAQFQALLTPDQPILVYCSGEECDESIELGIYLREFGFTNLVLFTGGYTAWIGAEGEALP